MTNSNADSVADAESKGGAITASNSRPPTDAGGGADAESSSRTPKILIVEDEKNLNDILGMLLSEEGYETVSAYDGREGLDLISRDIYDIVLTDIKMPHHDGFQILKAVKEISPDTIVIMVTAFGTTEAAVEAMKMGAYDYINKPFKIDEIRLVIKNALEKRVLSRQVKTLRARVDKTYRLDNIVGKSPRMMELLTSLIKVAQSNSNVLISGESGAGKELIAHAVHNLSLRSGREFVAINCAALPEGLLESELFGHMKGSFTGAASNKEGLFEVADEGTIFLDEIGDMPKSLQAKILRVLEDGSFRRIGGTKDIRVDVRAISATNKDLKVEIESGEFRQDLFYRLNVIPLHVPPLRERKEDIPLLVEHFLGKIRSTASGSQASKELHFSHEALETLMQYPWPGNVRELENAVERIVTFCDGPTITCNDLPSECRNRPEVFKPVALTPAGVNLDLILEDIEKGYLVKALESAGGGKTEAAKLLGISFRQFRHRLAKYGLDQ
jgi:two-component system response regulator PilR (NtrC family)